MAFVKELETIMLIILNKASFLQYPIELVVFCEQIRMLNDIYYKPEA